jgi:hypothetical protein
MFEPKISDTLYYPSKGIKEDKDMVRITIDLASEDMSAFKRVFDEFSTAENRKCIVRGCTNCTNEGEFVGDLCMPCFENLKKGDFGIMIQRMLDTLM